VISAEIARTIKQIYAIPKPALARAKPEHEVERDR
jgi:hypothetical protein